MILFFTITFQFPPCTGQSEIVPGQSELNKKDRDRTIILKIQTDT